MTPKLFENTNSVCLAQGLSFQPGLRVETNCQNCGFQQVRINGLDGPYTQLLLDGKALFSSLNGVYGIEQIPTGMIERVEVMRGGGSALYGANAIGGTVNIITKEPLNNLFMISHNLTAIGNSAYDNTTSLNTSLVNSQRDAGIYLFGTSRHRQHYDHDGDHFRNRKTQADDSGIPQFLQTHLSNQTDFRIPQYPGIPTWRKSIQSASPRNRYHRTGRS